jgi:aldehyde dehydrogenase (NAD+)
MEIAQEEIFGPVLSIMPYDDLDHAVEIANGTRYGLATYITGSDIDAARGMAVRIRTGQVCINEAPIDFHAPFGGYKQSGNGRERGVEAFAEFLETKAVLGY